MPPLDAARTPVIAAVGQVTDRNRSVHALDLAERAADLAFAGAPGLRKRIDAVAVPQILSPSGSAPASSLARRLGLEPRRCETTTTGGNTPQWLATRAARAITAGELDSVLVVGSEAMSSAMAGAAGRPERADRPDPVVGNPRAGTSAAEDAAGLVLPAWCYSLLESAARHRLGRSAAEHRSSLAAVLAPLSHVAAGNENAWFRTEYQPDEIAAVSDENRLVTDAYTKKMCAVLGVDQGAAFVVCSLEAARAAGADDGAVFVWSGADCDDVWAPSARPRLDASPALATAARAALEVADLDVDDISMFDLYSCFPIALEVAAEALGIDLDDARGLSLTGGLPYFGGPGNNYASHSIATATSALRDRGGVAMVSCLGWFLTKHSVGIYSDRPPPAGFIRPDLRDEQTVIDSTAITVAGATDDVAGSAYVDAATLAYGRDGEIVGVPAFLRMDDGRRVVATAHPDCRAHLDGTELVGTQVSVSGSPPVFRPHG